MRRQKLSVCLVAWQPHFLLATRAQQSMVPVVGFSGHHQKRSSAEAGPRRENLFADL